MPVNVGALVIVTTGVAPAVTCMFPDPVTLETPGAAVAALITGLAAVPPRVMFDPAVML